MEGFTATVMDLVNLGYISLHTVKSEESKALGLFKSDSEDVVIEIIDLDTYSEVKGNIRELDDFEKDVFNLLKSHASKSKISWNELKKSLEKELISMNLSLRGIKSQSTH